MSNVHDSASRGPLNARARRAGSVLIVVSMLSTVLALGLAAGFATRDAAAVPPAPVDGTYCYSIDEGTGNPTADQQFLHEVLLSGGSATKTSVNLSDNEGNIESIALRNDASEIYTYDPFSDVGIPGDQMYVLNADTGAQSAPTDFAVSGLGDIDAMFFQNDTDGDPTNDILWVLVDGSPNDTLTGYNPDGSQAASVTVTSISDPDTIEGATWVPSTGEFLVTYTQTAAGTLSTLASLGTAATPAATHSDYGTIAVDVESLGTDGVANIYFTTGEDPVAGAQVNRLWAVDTVPDIVELLDMAAGAPLGGEADFEALDCAFAGIALAKDLTAAPTYTAATDSWSMEFTYEIENRGMLALDSVTLTDDFNTVFAPGTLLSGPTAAGGGGATDCSSTALAGTASLNIGESCTATWTVEIQNLPAGDYDNTATVTGTPPNGVAVQVSDISEDGVAPSTPEVDTPTPVTIPENPVIGLAKRLSAGPTLNGSGNHDLSFTFEIENLGNTPLSSVTLTDPFSEYSAAGTIVSGPTQTSNNCPDPLPYQGTCTITIDIEVAVPAGTYNNSATVTGTSPLGVSVQDISNDGTSVDENGNGDPTDPEDETPTPAVIPAATQATLGDYVWNDLNGNGIQESGEPGIEGVTVRVFPSDAGGALTGAATTVFTDASGLWSLTVDPGYYRVEVVLPTGADDFTVRDATGDSLDSDVVPLGGTDQGFTDSYLVSAGDNELSIDAGVIYTNQVGDRVWNDLNANGIQDSGEPGIAGVAVELVDAGSTGIRSTVTDANGNWLISGVPAGIYSVQFTYTGTGSFTTRDAGADDADSDVDAAGTSHTFNLGATETNLTVDAGIVVDPTLGSISNLVWIDGDGDGLQGAESGLAGVSVVVYNAGGGIAGTATTDSTGNYLVDGLAAGDYTVEFNLPIGYSFTTRDVGLDDALDSDPDPATGVTAIVSLGAGEHRADVDAGVVSVPTPVIGLAKRVTSGPTETATGIHSITYTFVIDNIGNVDLTNVTLTDDFAATFVGATVVGGPTAAGGTCTADAMAGTLSLAVGQSCTAVLQVEVSGMVPGTVYDNTATVTGTSPTGGQVTDTSDDGSTTDANGNGNPADPGEGDPTPVRIDVTPVYGCRSVDGRPLAAEHCPDPVTYDGPFSNKPNMPEQIPMSPYPVDAQPGPGTGGDAVPLAVTGSDSPLLITLAIAMFGVGGVLRVGVRRQRQTG